MARRLAFHLLATLAGAATLGAALAYGDATPHYAGVSLAGAEFKPHRLPGRLSKDYTYPRDADFAYFAGQGMNVIRLPFLWERLQPKLNQPLDGQQLGLIRKAVSEAKRHRLAIILDLHNFGRYRGREVGSEAVPDAAFADAWSRLAAEFANDPSVIFGLMNEPARIPADRWARSAEAGIVAIRKAGARNLVLVPGTYYSGAHSWEQPLQGVSNADALSGFKDPADHFAFEAHQYFDRDFSGTSPACGDPSAVVVALKRLTEWLRGQGRQGFLGEFGVGADPRCIEGLTQALAYIDANKDAWLGWTYWAAGGWWGDYPLSVQPGQGGTPKPQMPVLANFARKVTGQ